MSRMLFTPDAREQARNRLLAVVRADGRVVHREQRSSDDSQVTLYLGYAHVITRYVGRHLHLNVRITHAVGVLYGLRNLDTYWRPEDIGGVWVLKRLAGVHSLQDLCESLANILDFARAH